MNAQKVALVHDWLTGMRGGEKVLEAALQLFPKADIFTLVHRPENVSPLINSRRIHTSWLNSLPGVWRYYRYLLPLMPGAIESFDLGEYDLVISFSHCVAKGVRLTPRPGRRAPLHLCYCHTPMRYVYEQFDDYFAGDRWSLLHLGARFLRPSLMRWDKKTSRGVDRFVANSENVRQRIRRAYGRDASVIYPTVGTDFFHRAPGPAPKASATYYLIAGALVPYKRVDLAIAACRKLGAPLKVVGVGTEEKKLRRLARGSDVEFLGWQSDEALRELYRNCEAFLFPADEDFGIAAVEAMACGRPVIAYKKGGSLETVVEGVTGVFFDHQTAPALADAMRRAAGISFDPAAIRAHALQFDDKHFKKSFARFVDEAWTAHAAAVSRTRVTQVVECGGRGGTGYQVAAICNGLDRSRFETSLVYAVRPGCSPHQYEMMARGAESFIHVPEMVREISPLLDIKALVRLYRIFREDRPDIVHAHSSKAGFLARVAAWAAGIERIYYSPRGYSFLQTDRPASVRSFYRILERLASLFGEVVAVSDSEASLARGLGAKRVRLVADAYLGETREPAAKGRIPRGGTGVVCASGRLTYARRPEAFVRLAQRLTDARNGVKCVWIGDGELMPVVGEMIRDLGLERKLEVTGWLSHEEALRRLAEADVFVHYSRWDAMPNSVLEAMAFGLPVIASDIPGNRGLVRPEENGFLAAGEPELLERTLQVLDDPGLGVRLGEKGRARVRAQYSRERLIEELSELYDS